MYIPICLLSNIGEIFERIVATRITRHFSNYGPDPADRQYGFRSGRPSMNSIYCVINMIKRKIERGDVVLELFIDTVNAFNSLPWKKIEVTL